MAISRDDLTNCYDLMKLTETLYELIERKRARVESTTSSYSTAPVGGGANDKIGGWMASQDALIRQFHEKLNEYAQATADVNEAIMMIEKPILQNLMICRYLEGLEWAEVAEKVGYSEAQTYRLHNEALETMGIKDDSP